MDLSRYPVAQSLLVGCVSATCSTVLFQPLDLVKTRLQTLVESTATTRSSANGVLSVFESVIRRDRISGLWKGMAPSMMRGVPGVGVYFASVQWMTTKFANGDPSASEAMCFGILARCFAGVSLLPFTVIKTRFESGVYQYESVLRALSKIYITEGARGLYSGLTATLIRDAPFSGIYLMIYTRSKKHIPISWKESQFSPLAYFSCGILSGALASLVTQPADVIKTQMQLYPERFTRTSGAILYIYQTGGYGGYFRGLVPRLMRRTLMSAMSWTVYEQLMKRIGLK